jgi:CRP-like cAMP-binding protein
VPFLRAWFSKEILQFSKKMKLRKFEVPGSIVIKEGEPAKKIVIIQSGEFELVKSKLEDVSINMTTG